MKFKINELKDLLSSITKNKIEKIHIKSDVLKITINAEKIIKKNNLKNKKKDTIQTKFKINTKNTNDKKNNESDAYFTIISPMIGTFYRSPAPNEPSFIEVNDIVKIKQTVCIIEAMKLMNEIESEVNGHVVEILVQDGDIVDCGQALMRVKHKDKK
uniref:Biotin carboxyl carrier protein of acetyl-CoA carboxylase n=1 Tax=Synarthrophyton chejuense TaxID=2485825 RepID=A0A3G3MFZ7_9FLOR|nr:acetyl-CoA carboxylase biotin carboxyl carrier protein [Synarthrophyton chejuense]AYR05742.1 acetyl-CoA carboxylase biotin carboxyl carrier protein [Synarthrophyton chejuense]